MRVSATLDVTTVLQGRQRPRAHRRRPRRVITTIDADDEVEGFVSSGFTAEQHDVFVALAGRAQALGALP